MKNIVVIGGGTGSFAILSGLKALKDVNLTAIVPSTDSGGSTGRLRDEFGHLPIGDVRQCLVALAENQEEELILRRLFSYRFDKGETGLKGHNFGNLFLTVVRDILNDDLEAIRTVQKLLNIKGNVYPVTLENTQLVAEYENGQKLVGEHNIDEPPFPHDGRLNIVNLYTEPNARTHPAVMSAIAEADIIILSPGDLYTSILANCIIEGMSDAICSSNAKLVYIMNLVTKFGQTYGFKTSNFVNEIEKYVGRRPDNILINNTNLPEEILEKYSYESAYPIENDIAGQEGVIELDLLADEEIVTPKGDVLKRSLIRHDGVKVAEAIEKILEG